MSENLKIGDTLYRHHPHARTNEYRFVGEQIVGETKFSWLVGDGFSQVKVNKKTLSEAGRGGWGPAQWMTQAQKDDWYWRSTHLPIIRKAFEWSNERDLTTNQLRRILAIIQEPK